MTTRFTTKGFKEFLNEAKFPKVGKFDDTEKKVIDMWLKKDSKDWKVMKDKTDVFVTYRRDMGELYDEDYDEYVDTTWQLLFEKRGNMYSVEFSKDEGDGYMTPSDSWSSKKFKGENDIATLTKFIKSVLREV